MNTYGLPICCLLGLLLCGGCPEPQGRYDAADASLRGIQLSDLVADEAALPAELQLSFTVLVYELPADSLDPLSKVYRLLPKRGIVYDDKTAFDANGFAVGVGARSQGSEVARALKAIGAVRTEQSRVLLPLETYEGIDSRPVPAQSLRFPTSHRTIGQVSLESGRLGWVLSAREGPVGAESYRVRLEPAFWQDRLADLRLLSGKVPFRFQTFDVGRVELAMEPGDFCVLGPAATILRPQTLNRQLFTASDETGRLLVIFLNRAGR